MPLPNIKPQELAERIALLERRLEDEGRYVDAALVSAAIDVMREHDIIDRNASNADLRYYYARRATGVRP